MAATKGEVTGPSPFCHVSVISIDRTAGDARESRREHGLATGLFLTHDGNVMVDYGKRKVPISAAQYKANGYKPRLGDLKLPAGVNGPPRNLPSSHLDHPSGAGMGWSAPKDAG